MSTSLTLKNATMKGCFSSAPSRPTSPASLQPMVCPAWKKRKYFNKLFIFCFHFTLSKRGELFKLMMGKRFEYSLIYRLIQTEQVLCFNLKPLKVPEFLTATGLHADL